MDTNTPKYIDAAVRFARIELAAAAAHAALLAYSDAARERTQERLKREQDLAEFRRDPQSRTGREPHRSHAVAMVAEMTAAIELAKAIEAATHAEVESHQARWNALARQRDAARPVAEQLAREAKTALHADARAALAASMQSTPVNLERGT